MGLCAKACPVDSKESMIDNTRDFSFPGTVTRRVWFMWASFPPKANESTASTVVRGIFAALRAPFLAVHSMVYASSSCFEMFIAFERILSTHRPDVYHVSKAYWKLLIPLTIFAVGNRK